MLGITIAQIRTSLNDSNSHADILSSTFAHIAYNVFTIHDFAMAITFDEPKHQMELELIQAASTAGKAKISKAIVDFQFFNNMTNALVMLLKA